MAGSTSARAWRSTVSPSGLLKLQKVSRRRSDSVDLMGKDALEVRSSAAMLLFACGLLAADPSDFFEMRIRPVLAKNCYTCHTTAKLGGLQLTSRENILKGGNSGPAVLPGKPEESLLIQAVSQTHERLKMPPQGKLKDEEIEDLKSWVRAGAV